MSSALKLARHFTRNNATPQRHDWAGIYSNGTEPVGNAHHFNSVGPLKLMQHFCHVTYSVEHRLLLWNGRGKVLLIKLFFLNRLYNLPFSLVVLGLTLNDINCSKMNLHSSSYVTLRTNVNIPDIHELGWEKYTLRQKYATCRRDSVFVTTDMCLAFH